MREKSSNRSFGIIFFIVFLLISVWPIMDGQEPRVWSLIISLIFYVRVKKWPNFLWFFINRNKPGVKAAILDSVLLEVFVTLQKKYKPDYSHLFFNGGAHIQHHYMFNSKVYKGNYKNPDWYCSNTWDPVLMILKTYDRIIGDLLKSGEGI